MVSPILWAARRLSERRVERFFRREPLIAAMIAEYRAASRSTGAGQADYYSLFEAVVRLRPRLILECGTGVTTIVLAEAVRRNGAGRIVSMEESREWHDHAVRILPTKYRDIVEIRHSRTVEWAHGMFRGMRYEDAPQLPYDFIFVDGPNTRSAAGEETIDMDLVHQVSRTEIPVSGIVDFRRASSWAYRQIFGDRFTYDPVSRLGFLAHASRDDLKPVDSIARTHLHPTFWQGLPSFLDPSTRRWASPQ